MKFGMTSAVNMEKPKTNIFLEEFMSVDCKMTRVSKTHNSDKARGNNPGE